MSITNQRCGVIRNKRDASIAVGLTAIIAGSAPHTTLQPLRLSTPWVFEQLYGFRQLTTPIIIALSVFFWAFVLWALFWFYNAARGKYERLLVLSFAVEFVLSVINRFMSSQMATNMQFLATAAALVSCATAIMLLCTLRSKTTTVQ